MQNISIIHAYFGIALLRKMSAQPLREGYAAEVGDRVGLEPAKYKTTDWRQLPLSDNLQACNFTPAVPFPCRRASLSVFRSGRLAVLGHGA